MDDGSARARGIGSLRARHWIVRPDHGRGLPGTLDLDVLSIISDLPYIDAA